MSETIKERSLNFIEEIVEADIKSGKYNGRILTRFPPEPNGYLHIGHAKSICLNFGIAQKYGGGTNLRFDDTNPVTEDTEYVEAIKEDLSWLGFKWVAEMYASDYFDQLFKYAKKLISMGLAYVDDSSSEQMALLKGTPSQAGKESPYRERSVEENLDLFEKMANGDFQEGSKVLRAKIDMSSNNMLMRDPIIYRIKFAEHHRTGNKWCIYPMYDFAHGQSDSIEGITHSICTLEFVAHRELYDWFLEKLEIFPSKQYEFARLNMTYTVMSKRKLLQLVNEKHVNGWDDPRMPTISGMRRRGYTPKSIVDFCDRIGIQKRENTIDLSLLEFFVREDLNKISDRVMAVFNPIKVVIDNFDANKTEPCFLENNPELSENGDRTVNFTKELYIEKDDFMENPPNKYFRLFPGNMVRLKGAYIIKCEEVIKNSEGEILELRCTYVENSKSGKDESGIKVKGVIHWVSATEAIKAEVRIYDRLFNTENPSAEEGDFKSYVNPNSLEIVEALVEPSLSVVDKNKKYQFIRNGYYVHDENSSADKLIFNKTVGLKDSYKPA
jgi:glutaminyl-tRNA synthetase